MVACLLLLLFLSRLIVGSATPAGMIFTIPAN